MSESWYDRCRLESTGIVNGYDQMLAAADRYRVTLAELHKTASAAESVDHEFLSWLEGQQKRLKQMVDHVETDVLDMMIRFTDRTVRVRHWEEGRFV